MFDKYTIYFPYVAVLPALSERHLGLSAAGQAVTAGGWSVTVVSREVRPGLDLYEPSVSEAVLQAAAGR